MLIAFWAYGVPKTAELAVVSSGTFIFALAGKIAHYKKRDKKISGNTNAWFPAWRHTFLADIFAIIGVILVGVGVLQLLMII